MDMKSLCFNQVLAPPLLSGQTHKRATCKAAWIFFLLGDPDAEAEVCAVKQG